MVDSRLPGLQISLVALSAAAALGQGAPASAQNPNASPNASPRVCVVGKHHEGDTRGRSFTIEISNDDVEKYTRRGFLRGNCAGTRPQTENERRRMCDAALTGNNALTLSHWRRFRVTPLEMCRNVSASANM